MRVILALAICLAGLGWPADAQRVPESRAEISLSFAPVVARAAPAVVTVYTSRRVESRRLPFAGDPFFERFFGETPRPPERRRTSLGSGVIVDPAGLVVSNHHVVAGADEIVVRLEDAREFEGRVILADEGADLAVIRLAGARKLPALALGADEALEVGDLVLAIGNPFGVGQTVTSGIVSGLARSVPGRAEGATFIQTDAAINPGNSGGALVDMSGRLVGVPTSILSRSGGSNGIGFAVPATLVARVIEAAEAGADRLPRPWLGVETAEVDRDIAAALGLARPRGLIVEALHPESPLARAGIRRGDVLLTAGESDLATPADLAYRAAALGPGARLTLTYLRNGAAAKARIPLAAPPERPPRDRTTFRRGLLAGLTVEAVNPAVIAERDLSATAAGVLVLAVEGPARRTGLRPGDLIRAAGRSPVETPRELARSVQRAGGRLALEVARGGRTGRVVLGR